MNQTNFAADLLNSVFSGVQQPENAEAVNTMLDKLGLNWSVSKQRLTLPTGEQTPFFGIVRDDTRTTFATCKDSYLPFQNSELAEMLIRISEKTGFEIHSGGSFNGGGKVYIQLESPNKLQGIGENRTTVNGYLTGLNSHDGTTSLKWGETNITVCCRNTFMAALRQMQNKARHTQGLHDKVEESIRQILGIVQEEKTLFDTFIKLAEIPATREHTAKIVRNIAEVDILLTKQQLKDNYSTYAVNRAEELLAAIAREMNQKGQTLWGLFSGVTRYTTHTMPVPKRDNARLESIYTGSAYIANNDALQLIESFS